MIPLSQQKKDSTKLVCHPYFQFMVDRFHMAAPIQHDISLTLWVGSGSKVGIQSGAKVCTTWIFGQHAEQVLVFTCKNRARYSGERSLRSFLGGSQTAVSWRFFKVPSRRWYFNQNVHCNLQYMLLHVSVPLWYVLVYAFMGLFDQ